MACPICNEPFDGKSCDCCSYVVMKSSTTTSVTSKLTIKERLEALKERAHQKRADASFEDRLRAVDIDAAKAGIRYRMCEYPVSQALDDLASVDWFFSGDYYDTTEEF